MNRRLKQAAVGAVIVFAAAQLVRPDRTNPPIDAGRTIAAQPGTSSRLAAIVDRSCRDCHSNATTWPWYARVAPVSWAMKYGVTAGRKAVNFSEWGAYEPQRRGMLLTQSCDDATKGKMPGAWTMLHPEAKLSAADIETICTAARQTEAAAARGSF